MNLTQAQRHRLAAADDVIEIDGVIFGVNVFNTSETL